MKKKLMMALSLVLVAVMSIGGTLAYLTSLTDPVKNTFTVGNVNITLDEANTDEYGVVIAEGQEGAGRGYGNEYKLIPGHKYSKDPIVHVTVESEPCYVFVKVVNDIGIEGGIEATNSDSTPSIAAQMEANGWVALDGADDVYYYNKGNAENQNGVVVDARKTAQDLTVFERFFIANGADVSGFMTENPDANITITAYAVQSDGFDTATEAWESASTSWVKTPANNETT